MAATAGVRRAGIPCSAERIAASQLQVHYGHAVVSTVEAGNFDSDRHMERSAVLQYARASAMYKNGGTCACDSLIQRYSRLPREVSLPQSGSGYCQGEL